MIDEKEPYERINEKDKCERLDDQATTMFVKKVQQKDEHNSSTK